MLATVVFLLATAVNFTQSQLTLSTSSLKVNITLKTTLQVMYDSFIPIVSDQFVNIAFGSKYLYTATSRNNIQIYSLADPSVHIRTYNAHAYANGISTNQIIAYMAVNAAQTLLIVAMYDNVATSLDNIVHQVDASGNVAMMNTSNVGVVGQQPSKVFMNGVLVFAYFKSTASNDYVTITDVTTGITTTQSLTHSNCSIAVAPNQQKVVVWSRISRVYIYSVGPTFNLLYVFNDSKNVYFDMTGQIFFDSSSTLAIIEAGQAKPLNIFNMTSLTLAYSIDSANLSFYDVFFTDSNNRYLCLTINGGTYKIIDLLSADHSMMDLTGTLPVAHAKVDLNHQLIYYPQTNINQLKVFSASILEILTNNPQNPDSPFYYNLQYTGKQDDAVYAMAKILDFVDKIMKKLFAVVHSTPFAGFFLSIFNYYMFTSIYVLLHIRIPYIIFFYFSTMFNSYQANVLQQFGIQFNTSKLTREKVTDPRALYFEVSSDLVSKNNMEFMIVVANILAVEIFIRLVNIVSQKWIILHKLKQQTRKNRFTIYFGLIVSNMMNVILPWSAIIQGGTRQFSTKVNSSGYYLIFMVLFFLLVTSFMNEFGDTKKGLKGQGMSKIIWKSIKKWWPFYQNFIYPFLVLLQNPIYFLVIIGLSQLIYLYQSLKAPQYKFFSILKAIYPIIIHTCFSMFTKTEGDTINITLSLICLGTYIMGSIHSMVEMIVKVGRGVYKVVKLVCMKDNISQQKVKKQLKVKHKNQIANSALVQMDAPQSSVKKVSAKSQNIVKITTEGQQNKISILKKQSQKDQEKSAKNRFKHEKVIFEFNINNSEEMPAEQTQNKKVSILQQKESIINQVSPTLIKTQKLQTEKMRIKKTKDGATETHIKMVQNERKTIRVKFEE